MEEIANDGMLSPVLEKEGILGPQADVLGMLRFRDGKGLAIDVAVTSVLSATNVRFKDPCEHYAAVQKHGK